MDAFANMVRSAPLTACDQNFLNNFMCYYSWVFSNVVSVIFRLRSYCIKYYLVRLYPEIAAGWVYYFRPTIAAFAITGTNPYY